MDPALKLSIWNFVEKEIWDETPPVTPTCRDVFVRVIEGNYLLYEGDVTGVDFNHVAVRVENYDYFILSNTRPFRFTRDFVSHATTSQAEIKIGTTLLKSKEILQVGDLITQECQAQKLDAITVDFLELLCGIICHDLTAADLCTEDMEPLSLGHLYKLATAPVPEDGEATFAEWMGQKMTALLDGITDMFAWS